MVLSTTSMRYQLSACAFDYPYQHTLLIISHALSLPIKLCCPLLIRLHVLLISTVLMLDMCATVQPTMLLTFHTKHVCLIHNVSLTVKL